MNRSFCGTWLSLAVIVLLVSSTWAAEPKPPVATFMRAKLGHSQKLLEALTTEDYDAMAKESQQLSLLTLAEQWEVLQTADYQQHSREFRRTAEALTEAAKKKNLDGAAFAYVELTMKCVNCHKYIKKARMASVDEPKFEKNLLR